VSPRTRNASKPRPRTRSASKPSPRTRKASKQGAVEFICPECGRSFARAAALGAHRRSAHGITGASSSAAAARSRAAGRPTSAQPRRPRRTTADVQRRVVNRDVLLRSLFPNGIPATEQALQQVNAWLEQAERLTRLR